MGSVVLNEESIQAKVREFSKSAKGQALIKQILSTKIETGISLCEIVGDVMDKAEMMEAANKMKALLIQHASGLPISIQAIVSSVGIGPLTKIGDGKYMITLEFNGDRARPSLQPSKYGYVSNIVALFNNGYSAGGRVYGEWHGQYIGSKQERAGTHFVNQAVAAFNSMYGAQYHATAEASGEYV